MGVVLGKDIFIYSGENNQTAVIAAAKSCTISMQCEVKEKASTQSATAREFVAGRTEWEISISHLVVTSDPFAGLLKVGTSVTVSVAIKTGTNTYSRKNGTAICVQAEIGGSVGSLGTGQAKFKGTGELR